MADETYVEAVRSAAIKAGLGKSEVIFNRSPEHAGILIASLISTSQSKVDILSGCLSSEVYAYSRVIEEARSASSRGNLTIRIALDGRDGDRILLVDELRSQLHNSAFINAFRADTVSLDVRYVPTEASEQYKNHFVVVDGTAFRYERNFRNTEAFANFNDKKNANELLRRFEVIFSTCAASLI